VRYRLSRIFHSTSTRLRSFFTEAWKGHEF